MISQPRFVLSVAVEKVPKVLEEDVLVESGTNMSIGCPGLKRNTFVVQLEWRCAGGGCGSAAGKAAKGAKQVKQTNKQTKNKTSTYFPDVAFPNFFFTTLHFPECMIPHFFSIHATQSHKLVRYVKDQGTTVFRSKRRLGLEPDRFSLSFSPVRPEDAGGYSCLVNGRAEPDAVITIRVIGEEEI